MQATLSLDVMGKPKAMNAHTLDMKAFVIQFAPQTVNIIFSV
jgi:hypothetical protein